MEDKDKYPSVFTLDNFSSTTKLADNEVKVPVGSKETINEKEYNPFDHREVEHPNTTLGSLVHLLKSSLGTGILAMPNAFRNAGWLFGFIGTVVVGLLCTHCVHILVKASHEICRRSKKPVLGFSDTAGAVFEYGPKAVRRYSKAAKLFVDVALVITYYMGCCVYVVFVASSIKQLFDYYIPSIEGWSVVIYMALILLPLIVICQIRELKYLVPFSFLANGFMIISFAITLYYIFRGFQGTANRKLFSTFEQLPLFFSTVIFAMEGIGVVMPVENQMEKPQQFLGCPGVLNIAMGVVIVLYAVIGFFGYLTYGEDTKASITFNLPVEEIPAQIVKAFIALSVFFTYSLQFYVPIDITWNKVVKRFIPQSFHNIVQIVLRSVIVACTVGVAMLVPNLEPIIGLVGSICFSILGIMIPAVVETVLLWEEGMGKFNWILWKNIILGIFAMFALVSGTYISILAFDDGH